jgi:hypothetical protein
MALKYRSARKGQVVRFHREGSRFDGRIGLIIHMAGGLIYVEFHEALPYGCFPQFLTPLKGREKALAMAAYAMGLTLELETETQAHKLALTGELQ